MAAGNVSIHDHRVREAKHMWPHDLPFAKYRDVDDEEIDRSLLIQMLEAVSHNLRKHKITVEEAEELIRRFLTPRGL